RWGLEAHGRRVLLPGRGLPDASDAFQPDVPVRGGYEWSRAPRLGLAEQPQWSDQPGEPERRHHVLPVSCLQVELTWSADRTPVGVGCRLDDTEPFELLESS